MNEQELREKIKGEVIAEQETKKAQDTVDSLKKQKIKFDELIEEQMKPQLEKFGMVIAVTELMLKEKYFEDIITYFRESYDKFKM